jgi:hypothetical protein
MSQYNKSHGMTGTPVYEAWVNINQRCNNPKCANYVNYGARGIKMCERWQRSFEAFYQDMGDIPFYRACIDRIDNNGNYEPSNCHWTTAKRNARNKRNNHSVEYNGQKMLLCELCEQTNMKESTILGRMRLGHTLDEALAMTARSRGCKQFVEWQGKRISLAQLAIQHGFHKDVIYRRMKRGWLLSEALSTPTKKLMRVSKI